MRLWVHLGCLEAEKLYPQAVSINITINFLTLPKGTKTDVLADTFCYFDIVKHIQESVTQRKFNLIENLTGYIYAHIYHDLLEKNYIDTELTVSVNKLNPPVPNVQGGVTFTCSGSLRQGKSDDLYQHWF